MNQLTHGADLAEVYFRLISNLFMIYWACYALEAVMPGSEISVWEVLKFMKLGADHATLKRKYNLSEEGLQDLYRQLSAAGFLEWTGERIHCIRKAED